MELISKNNIDRKRWDQLVESTPGATVYNRSVFLDELAEDWCAVIIGDYEAGMAVPFTRRVGVQGIYTPNFIRSLNWLGNPLDDFSRVEKLLRNAFKRCFLRMDEQIFSGEYDKWVYQVLRLDKEVQYGSQAKRSFKKFEKVAFEVREIKVGDVLSLVSEELQSKVKDLRPVDLQRFESLYRRYPQDELTTYGAYHNGKLEAAQFFVTWRNQLLFVKGAARAEALKDGAMYGLMKHAIEQATSDVKELSFEGSNVESVRNFYRALGGEDRTYYEWKWDHSPWWFKVLQKIKGKG